jgi:hypothetical protein
MLRFLRLAIELRVRCIQLFGERLATLLSLVEAVAYQKLDQRLAELLLAKGSSARNTPVACR